MDRRDFIERGLFAAAANGMGLAVMRDALASTGILVHRTRRMSGEVSAALGYSELAGEGKGNNGQIKYH